MPNNVNDLGEIRNTTGLEDLYASIGKI